MHDKTPTIETIISQSVFLARCRLQSTISCVEIKIVILLESLDCRSTLQDGENGDQLALRSLIFKFGGRVTKYKQQRKLVS